MIGKIEKLNYYGIILSESEVNQTLQTLQTRFVSPEEDITNKTIYLQDKSILQSKLRDHFSIKRKVEDAEIIIIEEDFFNKNYYTPYSVYDSNSRGYIKDPTKVMYKNGFRPYGKGLDSAEESMREFVNITNGTQKLIFVKDIYKYLYKYEVNLDFYNQCNNLLNSRNPLNTKLAMELMTNANWENDMVYLAELYNKYGQTSMRIDYRTSVSFKGFETTYKPKLGLVATLNNSLRQPAAYIRYCTKPEHFDFVNSIYKQEFENALNGLFNSYNITVKNLEYNINYDVRQELK